MPRIKNYQEQIYSGVLGKVIGVYMGRPFEGWPRKRIEAKWGVVDRYVHEDQGVPLVVGDDDISGTFTFIRALEDSGLYAKTPPEFYGETWLNYLLENKTVLWWGGMGHSTEHTAYLRLKHGVPSPQSGSIKLNGKTVAEQIGAQIFIDGFGMVAPGNPELAVEMATHAARVSHDGEAVHAARVVAAMVSAAFVEKRMSALLDIGIGFTPERSLIARVHRDVRQWAGKHMRWQDTMQRIEKKYGYDKYGGNCHVVPNHAIMVMAWAHAPDDFHKALSIACTAGWDTDCNAGNVGSVMGLVVGVDRINESYEFQAPFADRVRIAAAEGTHGITDCAALARRLEAIGNKVMRRRSTAQKTREAWHDFELPGSLHGYLPEEEELETRDAATLKNVPCNRQGSSRALRVRCDLHAGKRARISTPVLATGRDKTYADAATPRIYPGNDVVISGDAARPTKGMRLRPFVRCLSDGALHYGKAITLASGRDFTSRFSVPAIDRGVVLDFGFEIAATKKAAGDVFVRSVHIQGKPKIVFPEQLTSGHDGAPGWVVDADTIRGSFSDDNEALIRFGKNQGRGVAVCGNTDWHDYTFSVRLSMHMGAAAGILARYRGLKRYIALERRGDQLQLVRHDYGRTVLAQAPCKWKEDELHPLSLTCRGSKIVARADGKKLFEVRDTRSGGGGAGVFFEEAMIGVRDIVIE